MRLRTLLLGLLICNLYSIQAQISFSNETLSILGSNEHQSAFPIGVADMNADLLDDIIILAEGDVFIYYQNPDSSFTQLVVVENIESNPWSLCIADVDKNGFNDMFTGGEYTELRLLTANSEGTSYEVSNITPSFIFLQGSNFTDIDNDGDVDLFTCDDNSLSPVWENDGLGNFALSSPLLINTTSTVLSDNSGNYGSVWTDYDNDGDQDLYLSKCRADVVDSLDGRRLNLLFQNNGQNEFTEVAAAAGLQPKGQSWATDFADVDNDGDLDAIVINHIKNDNDIPTLIYKNNGDGTFINFTDESGLTEILTEYKKGLQCIFEDFDNDGFVDLFLTAKEEDLHYILHNNGDFTFSEIINPFPDSPRTIYSAAVGDLNDDGFIDVCATYDKFKDDNIVWINDGNDTNNYIVFLLKGINCNSNGIGARVELYGEWGKQIREVRSGESYGIMNSFQVHFGLGPATSIDSLIVRWPHGKVDKQDIDFNINQVTLLEEGDFPSSNFSPFDQHAPKVFPNPTHSSLTIKSDHRAIREIRLYDLSGKLILLNKNSSLTHQVDLSALTNGLYYLSVTTLSGVHKFPIVKARGY